MRNAWQEFIASEQSLVSCMSKRGHHPKMQDLLQDVQTQINCRAWLEEHSDDIGPERSAPASFARWLNSTELPAMLEREKDSHRKIGVLVAKERTRSLTLPQHGRSEFYMVEAQNATSAFLLAGASTSAESSSSSVSDHTVQVGKLLTEVAKPVQDPAAGARAAQAKRASEEIKARQSVTISEKTAGRYMQSLGYTRRYWRKGTFFDGHDRPDVVAARLLHLAEKLEHDKNTLHAMPSQYDIDLYMQLPPSQRPFIESCTMNLLAMRMIA